MSEVKPVVPPAFIAERLEKFIKLQEKHQAEDKYPTEFTVTVYPKEEKCCCQENATPAPQPKELSSTNTLFDAAKAIVRTSKVYNKFICAATKSDCSAEPVVRDLSVRLDSFVSADKPTVTIEFLTYEDERAQEVFRHSSAHLLGASLELEYGGHLGHGPATPNGFFYDIFLQTKENIASGAPTAIDIKNLPTIDERAALIVKEASKKPSGSPERVFTRLMITKAEALDLFSYSPLKCELISEHVADGDMCSTYRCGNFVDFCLGPHVPDLALLGAFKCTNCSAAYFKGDQTRESMQRVYGICFPKKEQLENYLFIQEEAKRRDHRVIAKEMELFTTHPYAPGMPLFLPNGASIYRRLERFITSLLQEFGYQEVITPNFFNTDLWKTSGHLGHYRKNMFFLHTERNSGEDGKAGALEGTDSNPAEYAIKAMNCPGHCLIYKNKRMNKSDLPYRMAEFGVVHRNELSGALSGLTRVCRFEQDDAHIFCAPEQIFSEIEGIIAFLKKAYSPFGLTYEFGLSLRPKDRVGSDELWDTAETALRNVLTQAKVNFVENPGEGAFYGPKIDVLLTDALGRKHQCGTVQLDFNLPSKERFNLEFYDVDPETKQQIVRQPVMIHRAILGSIERFMAIIIEHTAGKFPFWLSPRQMVVVPLGEDNIEYAHEIKERFHKLGYDIDVDDSSEMFEKKIAVAWAQKYNYIAVVGKKEAEEKTVALSGRSITPIDDSLSLQKAAAEKAEKANKRKRISMSLDELEALFKKNMDERIRN